MKIQKQNICIHNYQTNNQNSKNVNFEAKRINTKGIEIPLKLKIYTLKFIINDLEIKFPGLESKWQTFLNDVKGPKGEDDIFINSKNLHKIIDTNYLIDNNINKLSKLIKNAKRRSQKDLKNIVKLFNTWLSEFKKADEFIGTEEEKQALITAAQKLYDDMAPKIDKFIAAM